MEAILAAYRLLTFLGSPVLLGAQAKASRRALLKPRLFPPAIPREKRVLWVHTLSLGEVEASLPLLEALRGAFPGHFLVFTVATRAGLERARKKARAAHLIWPGPLDLPGLARRYLQAFHPEAFVLVESDLWPGLLWAVKRAGVPLIWANAALSTRSAKRLSLARPLARLLLEPFDFIAAASRGDAERLKALLPEKEITFFGNLKAEFTLPPREEIKRLKRELRPFLKQPVLVCGSTHPGEEEVILEAFGKVRRGSLILCPRKPERAGEVKELAQKYGFKAALRSAPSPAEVLVVDTLGELKALYALGDLALVGGSLVPVGGHNLLEPLAFGLPVLVGPHLESVADLAAHLKGEGVLLVAEDLPALVRLWRQVLDDLEAFRSRAARAFRELSAGAEVSRRYVEILKKILN